MIAENIHSMICIASYFKKRQCWFLDFMIITVSVLFLLKRSADFFYMFCCSKRPHRENINSERGAKLQQYRVDCPLQTSSTCWVFSWKVQHRFFFCVVISIIIIWLSIFLPHLTHNWQQTKVVKSLLVQYRQFVPLISSHLTSSALLPVIIYCIDFLTKSY